ncbi:MAG: NAD(P)/FAD-dependent oxidoreductase [bacterium]|nr:FAD-containing monooxygenase EthA [Deltaproteobacteria bacterium]MCP4903718.1 NAD(P)/FAD-dependent oxidoreductase [bacterium]
MTTSETRARSTPPEAEHFDVVMVGAGISGIGAAYHLKEQCPEKSFVVLEGLESFGGTWLIHRYPGIRSDSDLYTFGYRFKPWIGPPIATAEEILCYMGEVISENALGPHIRYGHKIFSASWSNAEKRWTLEGTRAETGAAFRFTTNFLWMCQGYYRHSQGYTPRWKGMEDFAGEIIHPQTWPEDLEYRDKNVVVIGSGATAATVVPAIAADCSHVTLLQRSPTYFIPGRNENELADRLRELEIDESWVHEITRKQIIYDQAEITRRSFDEPEVLKEELLGGVRAFLGPDFDIEKHFTPVYRPWRQRIAFVPDGDIFQGIASGQASIVTEEIDRFTQKGIRLASGEVLEADIIVTATGFNLSVLGDIDFTVDDEPIDFSKTVTYRGMMFTGVPNMLWIFGYFRASWTLRVDLLGDFVCRLLNHMEKKNATKVTTVLRPEDEDMPLLPWMDPENFNPGYLMRSMHLLPRRGDKPEWQHTQDYWAETHEIPAIDLDANEFDYE